MDLTVLWWVLAGLIVITGLVSTLIPQLPGVPIVFVGLWLAAWASHFEPVGAGTLLVLGGLTLLAWLVDLVAASLGAKRLGASPRAFWGALLGTVIGIFFGLPGLLFGPFIGAVAAELGGGRDLHSAGRAGVGVWLGTAVGVAVKLAIAFLMVGWFLLRQFLA